MGRLFKRAGSDVWWADWRDETGRRRRESTKVRDERAARQILAQRERDAELARAGLMPVAREHLERPILEHVAEWADSRLTLGQDVFQVRKSRREVEGLIARAKVNRLRELRPERIRAVLFEIRKGASAKTTNNKRGYLCSFLNWCKENRRIVDNPCDTPEFPRVDSRKRRALTLPEVRKLLSCGEIPPERRAVWRALIGTGLRAGEAAALEVGWVRLDSPWPSVYIPSHVAKSGEEEQIPLNGEMVRLFKRLTAGKPMEARVFGDGIPASRRFKKDLKLAGIPIQDHRGHVACRHSLRHTFVSLLRGAGNNRSDVMLAARHRSEDQTQDYTDESLIPVAGVVGRMPTLIPTARLAPSGAPSPVQGAPAAQPEEGKGKPDENDRLVLIGREWSRGDSNPLAAGERGEDGDDPDAAEAAFWGEARRAAPVPAPRPPCLCLPDDEAGRARLIEELRSGTRAAYVRGGVFCVIDIPAPPAGTCRPPTQPPRR